MNDLKNTIIKFYITFILIVLALVLCSTTFAAEIDITTSSVRDDLESMEMDNLSYLSNDENIFITMAQYYDTKNNLRSYLYFNYVGSTDEMLLVNLSTSVMDDNYEISENFINYELKFINNDSTWVKYEILDLPNVNDTTRRYYINSISKAVSTYNISTFSLDDNINEEDGSDIGGGNVDNDTTLNSIILQVNQVFIYNGITNESIKVFHQEVETITITDKAVACYCYGDDWDMFGIDFEGMLEVGNIYTDAWYVFFNTDKRIDELLSVKLTYKKYEYSLINDQFMQTAHTEEFVNDYITNKKGGTIIGGVTTGFKDLTEEFSWIKYDNENTIKTIESGTEKVASAEKDWLGNYVWQYEELDNIMNLKEYEASSNETFVFTDYAEKYSWGVHFLDTERSCYATGYDVTATTGYGMCDVAILELTFVTDGVVKNCYAVDVPTDDFEGEVADKEINTMQEWFEKIMMLIGITILLVMLNFVLPIFKFIFNGIVALIKIIIYIITLPFKLIGTLFKRRKY